MFDMFGMMGKIKEAQEKMKEVQDKLAQTQVVGEAAGGMIKATVNGRKQLLQLTIEDIVLSDKAMMQDLIVVAVNQAMQAADELAKTEIKSSMNGLLPNIPGLDLENLLNK